MALLSDDDLDDMVRRVDPERWLATRFIADPLARADVIALYAFDHELARAPRVASTPLIAEIRLTWWSEALDEIFAPVKVRGHPVAVALEAAVGRRGLKREDLQPMIDGRIASLEKTDLSEADAVEWSERVGGAAAMAAAVILDRGASTDARLPGTVWGLKRLADTGAVSRLSVAAWIESRWPAARAAAHRLSVAAFPSVAHVALVRTWSRDKAGSPSTARLRLLWAVMTGRL